MFGETVIDPSQNLVGSISPSPKPIYGGPMSVADKQLFAFTDTLFASDRKNAWLQYQRLLRENFDVNSQIIPKIWWVLKSINSVRITDTKDLKPSTLAKASITEKKWHSDILLDITLSFIEIIAENRSGSGNDIATEIEGWILRLPIV